MTNVDVSRIYGKIKIVDHFADLHVKKVNSFPNSPGKWEFVDSFPDFKIKFFESFRGPH